MSPLATTELLRLWERGAASPPATRALTLLAAARPDTPPEQLARLPVGRRDAALLRLREQTFGPRLPCVAECPACGETLEWDFAAPDLGAPDLAALEEIPAAETHTFRAGDCAARFRLPDSRDLAELAPHDSAENNRQRLLRACVLEFHRGGGALPPGENPAALPPDFTAALLARMAELDPLADVRLGVNCPACRHAWDATFDIAGFFFAELSAWAARLLREVHELAAAHGWSEAEILHLSPHRRRAYLEMIRA